MEVAGREKYVLLAASHLWLGQSIALNFSEIQK
jgi:hypothetical protein